MIGRLNHIAIVVPDLAAATAIYRDTLGATVSQPRDMPEHGVTTVFVELANSRIELLHPLGDESPVTPFLARHPAGGMHHICYEVEDILAARDRLAGRGAVRRYQRRRQNPRHRAHRRAPPPQGQPRQAPGGRDTDRPLVG